MDRLVGVIQSYEWGDAAALSDLLGHRPPGHPEAEYWLGAHPDGPGLLGPDREPLDEAIRRRPGDLLGPAVATRFGGLPYLVKILAAARPLSIQAHPGAAQAATGFEREERDGPPRTAPDRNYRDPNHKPELICALTPFEARCGFRDPAVTAETLTVLGPPLDPLLTLLAECGPADAAACLLRWPGDEAEALARSTVEAAARVLARGIADEAVRAEMASTVAIGKAFPGDVGVVVALLLNHLCLKPGQAVFLGAGNLHAYVRGVGIEVMANSDNVLRGGLTSKHIDIDELDAVLERRWGTVDVLDAVGPVHTFEPPIAEFALTRIDSSVGSVGELVSDAVGPEVVLVTRGSVELIGGADSLVLDRGDAALVGPADGPYRLVDRAPGRTQAWSVTVGAAAVGR